jgi:hypothetical protein
MIAVLLNEVAAAALVAADDGGPVWLLALGPAGGAAVYFGLWSYYRNADASHNFERETRVGAQPVTGHDAKVDEVNGTKRSRIDGDNSSDHRERVQRID